ncbi:gametogenetin-binding protein 1-like isoform X2 [Erinaceus europaeus]|uniref:Gametogenetin-binding protein 1-like isoform X2 n=1 Tax=Erinaceus europaeus TaxID=9365 RepID=A0ABM3X9W4_ERIEU|nr:gametogenetin-binding protein 1-like isoform X2 [Erinaceus europaeus]
MSSPIMASCRPTCPMVLEEQETGGLRLSSSKENELESMEAPWSCLLTLYKQLQKSALAKEFSSQEEEEEKEKELLLKLCDPGTVDLQSTDAVGFVELELKKLLAAQQDFWKTGRQEGQELLTQPEVSLGEAGIVDSQGHHSETEREGNSSPGFEECWGPEGGILKQQRHHPRLETKAQSHVGVMLSRTEPLLLEEMDEMGN